MGIVERAPRLLHGTAIAGAVVLVHCADPAVVPRVADFEAGLDVQSTSEWSATTLTVPKGATTSAAQDVNDAGDVVGSVTFQGAPGPRATRWINGHPALLSEPKGKDPKTHAEGVNNSGIIVGWFNPGSGENKAVRWAANGTPTLLPALPGGAFDIALSVNDGGVIVGQSKHHAVRWIRGVIEDLHPASYAKSAANDINAAGDIAGWVEYATGERRAYLWHADGSQEELGVLPGDQHSYATGLNDGQTIVGSSGDLLSASRAFLWTQANGISNSQLGASKTLGTDIGNSGRIVGYREVVVNGQLYSFALTRLGNTTDMLPNPQRVRAQAHGVNVCGTVVGTIHSPQSGVMRATVWTRASCDP